MHRIAVGEAGPTVVNIIQPPLQAYIASRQRVYISQQAQPLTCYPRVLLVDPDPPFVHPSAAQ